MGAWGDMLKAAAARGGLEVSRFRPVGVRRQTRIHRHAVDLIIDGGANRGQYGEGLRRYGYLGRLVSLEPIPEVFAELSLIAGVDPLWDCLNVALGGAPGKSVMHVASNTASSSLRHPNEAHRAAAPAVTFGVDIEIQVVRLDDLPLPDHQSLMLKLDVQGYELEALRGADELLRNVQLLECELSIVQLYEGQPLLADVVSCLNCRGFDLIALEPGFYNPSTGEILQFDAFFAPAADKRDQSALQG